MLKCENCCYNWQDEGAEYATCHFIPVCFELPPCEDDDYTESKYDEFD